MSRYAYNATVRDKKGYALESATVIVYIADSVTPATIYSDKSGGSAISGAELTTDSGGRYSFYVDDSDYVAGQLFDIKVSKSGFSTYTLSDEMVF